MAIAAPAGGMGRRTGIFLSLLPPLTGQRRLALALIGLSVALFAVLVPFAKEPLMPVPAFIPSYQAALLISDLITACVFFGQFSIQRTRALLILGGGYFFTALAIIPHSLSFPGLFAPSGLMGSGPQTTVWLFMLWHGGFPLLIMLYAWLKQDDRPLANPGAAMLGTMAAAVLVVGGTTYLTTAQQWLLPTLLKPDNTYTAAMLVLIIGVWALNLVALLVLWLRGPHTALDLWMMIVMVAWTCDVGLSAALNAKRFDMGFYAGRVYGLAAAIFVLVMLLLETRALYVRLASGLAKDRDSAARRAQRVFDTSLDLILVTDPHGKFVEVNGASQRILGYPPEEMIGKSGRDFIYPDDLDATRQRNADCPPRRRHTQFQVPLRQPRRPPGVAGLDRRVVRGRPPAFLHRPRRHREGGARGAAAAVAEDGGGRPADRRRGARFQQHPDGDPGQRRGAAGG
jgi:PAS domain-containing protein